MILTYLKAAEYVLERHGKPLTTKEIVDQAIDYGVFNTQGETPWKTFNSKLSIDILKKKESSTFMRVAEGVYALRKWSTLYPEYIAKRYVKRLYDEDIAVIETSDLNNIISSYGLTFTQTDFSDLFHPYIKNIKRRDAEQRYDVVQLVSSFIIEYRGKYLTHMRSARLPESRLHGEYSIMVGGHLGVEDFTQMDFSFDTEGNKGLAEGMLLRELSEEIVLKTEPTITRVGLLYDDSRDVSKQHIGLVYKVILNEDKLEIGERGFLMNHKFEKPSNINKHIDDFENWSIIIINNIKDI